MCQIYAGTDPVLYQKTSRSLRMHGQVTSVALENRFWQILDEMARQERVSVSAFITTLHDEVLERYGEVRNFSSLLRVACTTYLLNQLNTMQASSPSSER